MIAHAIHYFIGQGVARGVVHFLTLYSAKMLSPENFVSFSLFLISANIYSRVANGSLNMVMSRARFGGEESARSARQDRLYRVSSTFGLVLTLALVAAVVLMGVTIGTAWIGKFSPLSLSLALVSGYLTSVENNLIEVLQSKFQSQRYMAYMIGFTMLLILFGAGSYGLGFLVSDSGAMVVYVAAQALALIIAKAFKFTRHIDRVEAKTIFNLGILACLYGVTTYLYRYMELVVINRFLPTDAMASFTFVFRLMESLNLVTLAAGSVIAPLIFTALQEGQWTARSDSRISKLLYAQIAFFALFTLVVPFGVHWFEPRFSNAVVVAPYLLAATLISIFVAMAQAFMLFYDRYRLMVGISAAGLGVATGLGFLLAPTMGSVGVVLAKVAAQLLILVGYAWSLRSQVVAGVRLRPWRWVAAAVVALAAVIVGYQFLLTAYGIATK